MLLRELQELCRRTRRGCGWSQGRTGTGEPPFPPFDAPASPTWSPTSPRRDVYVCGPPPMTQAVVRGLQELKVPRGQVHSERFGLA